MSAESMMQGVADAVTSGFGLLDGKKKKRTHKKSRAKKSASRARTTRASASKKSTKSRSMKKSTSRARVHGKTAVRRRKSMRKSSKK